MSASPAGRLCNADPEHILVKEGSVMAYVPFYERRKDVKSGVDPAASGNESLIAGDLNGCEVGLGCGLLSCTGCPKTVEYRAL